MAEAQHFLFELFYLYLNYIQYNPPEILEFVLAHLEATFLDNIHSRYATARTNEADVRMYI